MALLAMSRTICGTGAVAWKGLGLSFAHLKGKATMGAEVTWYVKVKVPMEEILTVSAVTSIDAEREVRRQYPDKDIISVENVYDDQQLCHNCGALLPDGCGGLFQKDGDVCKRPRDAADGINSKEGK
jgi:hypothetical protein